MCKSELDMGRVSMATYICLEKHSCIRIDRVLVLCNVIAVCFSLLRVMLHVITAIKRRDNGVDRPSLGLGDHPMISSHVSTSRP
jgi:hypothetical protein